MPYQEAPTPPMEPRLVEACARAVHLVSAEGEVLRAGRAVLFVMERIGFPWTARFLRLPPMIWFVELGYWVVANNRVFFSKFLFRPKK